MTGTKHICATVLLFVFISAFVEAEGVTTLKITRELVLRDVEDVELTARFRENVDRYVRKYTAANVVSNVYKSPPDVVIVSRAWFTGEESVANASFNKVNKIFDSWEAQPDGALISDLSNASLRELGVQPRTVTLSDDCRYGDTAISSSIGGFGFNNLSLKMRMIAKPPGDLVARLCSILAFVDCSLIVLNEVKQDEEVYNAKVTITTSDRNYCMVLLMNNFLYSSGVLPQTVESVVIAGKEVFKRPYVNSTDDEIPHLPCSRRFWYLIFLVLLVPLSLFVGQRVYYDGVESGKRAARALEWDIRGGVRYQERTSSQQSEGRPCIEFNYGASSSTGSPYLSPDSGQTSWSQRRAQNVHYDPNEIWQNGESQMMQSTSSMPPASSRQ